MATRLTSELAARLARIALGHVTREYPNKPDHVLRGPDDLRSPRALHPIFYGSFDWHSCVHGYWLLARLYRRFPELPQAAEIRCAFDSHFVAKNVAAETEYLREPAHRGFERPYGWAWLAMLAAELARQPTEEGRGWGTSLRPLADAIAERFRDWLATATYPVRAGTHANSAFALALAMEYAQVLGDHGFRIVLAAKAAEWFAGDVDCQAWEPGGEDFLSPALIEAECMRRALAGGDFRNWFERFLPRPGHGEPGCLFRPAIVSDRSDGRIVHLDGLNLSRAWCWRALAGTMDEPARSRALAAAEAHLEASLPHLADDYMGEHWLGTFGVLALDG